MFKKPNSPSDLLRLAALIPGVSKHIPYGVSLALTTLGRAPSPKPLALSDDWGANVDVLSHAIGCYAVGFYDHVFDGLEPEEVAAVEITDVLDPALDPIHRIIIERSFETFRDAYVELGPLKPALEAGEVTAEGLILRAVMESTAKAGVSNNNKPTFKNQSTSNNNEEIVNV